MVSGTQNDRTAPVPFKDPANALLLMAIGAVASMVMAVRVGVGGMILLPAVLFTVLSVGAALVSNAALRATASTRDIEDHACHALGLNARLLGAAYGFCAFAMQALYITQLTGLRWQHSWQYACAFALLGGLSFEYGRMLLQWRGQARRRLARYAVPLAIAQAVFAAGGMVFLNVTGKVLTRRPDWAANIVFLFAALLVMMLCAITLRTHARLHGASSPG